MDDQRPGYRPDFPRSIREDLILQTHQKMGLQHAALTGTIATYMIRGPSGI